MVFGIAGVFFGVLIGWMIGSQQTRSTPGASPAAQSSAAPSSAQPDTAKPFDERRAASLREQAEQNRSSAELRVELGNLYFDAERFADASQWYEAALSVDPKNVNASTDLGIAYYYMNQADRALAQFDRSLAIDPKHAKTLLNVGIVRAYGKQDLDGAAKAWQQVVAIAAPESPEARMAQQALQSLRSAHPEPRPGGQPGDGSSK